MTQNFQTNSHATLTLDEGFNDACQACPRCNRAPLGAVYQTEHGDWSALVFCGCEDQWGPVDDTRRARSTNMWAAMREACRNWRVADHILVRPPTGEPGKYRVLRMSDRDPDGFARSTYA